MLITAVRASWLHAPIPAERAHVSDFGRNDSFNMCLVEVEESVELEDGYVLAPTRPGLGLTLRRDFVKQITVPA
jgi:L-alanine-DL-glutamate epimerase-like enolase superfamily enzyme